MQDLLPDFAFFMPAGHPQMRGEVRQLQAKPAPGPRPRTAPPPPRVVASTASRPTAAPSAAVTAAKATSAPPAAKTTAAPTSQYLAQSVCSSTVSSTPLTSAKLCELKTLIYADLDAMLSPMTNTQKSFLFGPILRLAFHDAGEVNIGSSTDKFGPDGCLSFTADNAGLIEATKAVSTIVQPWWQKYCPSGLSRGDFWALLAKAVVERSAALGSATVVVDFWWGRKDNLLCDSASGRLPSGLAATAAATQATFLNFMGLTANDAVTLIGAHSVGHVSPKNSGFGNPALDATLIESNSWDQTPHILDNQYFVQLITKPWTFVPATATTKQDYADTRSPGHIMLDADMALGFQITANTPPLPPGQTLQNKCGGPPSQPCLRTTSTQTLVDSFIASNAVFVAAFGASFTKMCNVGFTRGTVKGHLGTLTQLKC